MRLTLFAILLLVTSPALAEEARRFDFTAALAGIDGKPIVPEKDAPPLTLGDVAASALTATFKDENPSGQDKVKRWALALRVHNAKDAELTVDDVKTIKDMIGKAYGPVIVGPSWAILDPASVK
jgi:hypothetical protein